MTGIELRCGTEDDAGEMLTLQRAAYVTEAQIYRTPFLAPLTQTLDELEAELAADHSIVAINDQRMIGAVRFAVLDADPDVARIGGLVVAPDWQGQGVGTRLLAHVEQGLPETVKRLELFTGHKSVANIALYSRLGYSVFRRQRSNDLITLVYMAKHLA